jgi:hypothetical protein
MKTTTTIIAMTGALTFATALTAHAQAPQTETRKFVNVNGGGQLQSRSFSGASTFELFNENGTVATNQTIGSGFVFDVTGGYRRWTNTAVAVGLAVFRGSGEAAALAAVPNPLFFGVPTLKAFTADDLSQTNVAINFQIVWTRALTNRLDLALSGGPSIIRVSQELPSVTLDEAANPTTVSESATTGKAGSAGVDLSYRVNDRYSIGGFVRYLGGQVDLDAIENLTVGGAQAGGGIRIRF